MDYRRGGAVLCGLALILEATAAGLASERGACEFVIPPGAVTEQDALPGGLPSYLRADIPCDDTLTGAAASGPNLGCSAAPGPLRNFTPLTIGVAMKGDSHALNGSRDTDWYAAVNQFPVNGSYIIDYSIQSEPAVDVSTWFAVASYAACQINSFAGNQNTTPACGARVDRRALLDTRANLTPAIGLDGGPNDDLLIRVRNSATDGYGCAAGLNDYWLRINWILPASQCLPVADPAGVAGTDYFDERDPSTSTTFDGSGGASGVMHEPCNYATPNDGLHRGKRGCFEPEATHGDFIRLNPNVPQIGSLDVNMSGSASRDVDWYKFELAEQSLVHLTIACGGPAAAFIMPDDCESVTTLAFAATLGHCGGDPQELEGELTLDAGVYIVLVQLTDIYSGSVIFSNVDCRPTSTEYGLSKYRLDLTTSAVPPCCAGNADHQSGQVDFNDVSAVIANWQADYGIGNTGPGDATCGLGDGVVNFDDINAVLANWLNACP